MIKCAAHEGYLALQQRGLLLTLLQVAAGCLKEPRRTLQKHCQLLVHAGAMCTHCPLPLSGSLSPCPSPVQQFARGTCAFCSCTADLTPAPVPAPVTARAAAQSADGSAAG